MIDLPLGKAIVAVEAQIKCDFECMDVNKECLIKNKCCYGCELKRKVKTENPRFGEMCGTLVCVPFGRMDNKKVIFKIVDYKTEK